ncbi:MAG: hypothetical protein K2K02_09265 [Ruminococcus sp.]|nr:hypothetical protein [Ruminococcus sp.]
MSRNNKNEEIKEKKKSNFIPILVVLLLIIAILMIVASFGFGGGFGKGNGDGDGTSGNSVVSDNSGTENSENSEISESEEETSETTVSHEIIKDIQVTVSENSYIMDGVETDIDSIIETASGDNIVVEIIDENAVADTMDSLISALSENKISYFESIADENV